MNDLHIKDFLERQQMSQKELADLIGITPGGLCHILSSERDVRVRRGRRGKLFFYEVKPLGKAS